mgnify:CR=1 FL=1|jgi:hypothetical protein
MNGGEKMNIPHKKVLEDADVKQIWARPCQLCKIWGMGRTTMYNKIEQFRQIAKYKKSYIDVSHTVKLIRIKDFESFMMSLDHMYLKK